MSKQTILLIVAIIAIVAGVFIYASTAGKTNSITLFYSLTCPHCKKVEDFIATNNILAKLQAKNIAFENKEVSQNGENSAELVRRAQKCGYTGDVGVPFLWNGSQCIVGDVEITNYLGSL